MAIYSLHHSAIGKASQEQPHTAAAHVRYITRESACSQVLAQRMPASRGSAQRWYRQQEDADRKNARICDKLMLALPRELTPAERHQLIREFAEEMTQGKAPWLAAFHDKGKDAKNPHCHLIIRDRDPETGKRLLYLSAGKKERAQLAAKGIQALHTERIRAQWADHANRHLERAGHAERIDHRTLEAQGVEREATIHEGVRARQMEARGERPRSKIWPTRNGILARSSRKRMVDYRRLDSGRTRAEVNIAIRQSRQRVLAPRKRSELEQSPAGEARDQVDRLTRRRSYLVTQASLYREEAERLSKTADRAAQPERGDALRQEAEQLREQASWISERDVPTITRHLAEARERLQQMEPALPSRERSERDIERER